MLYSKNTLNTNFSNPAKGVSSLQYALLSVADKTGIVDFARVLANRGIVILSTGGTASLLRQQGITVIEVATHTGFPEILDGRVKTLHPKIHGGLLARGAQDADVLRKHKIDAIHILAVNLYPFQATISQENCSLETAIEHIDIGGPAMLRSAAKNYQHTTAIVDPADYPRILQELNEQGATSVTTRFELACKVFVHTAGYDGAIANYLSTVGNPSIFPQIYSLQMHKKQDLRYGENPHQQGAFYVESNINPGSISGSEQLQGKALSYNNIVDANTALECVKSFSPETPSCVIVKHANLCGAASGQTQAQAYQRAYKADPSSAFGGIIAFNTSLAADTASLIIKQQFVEIILAPEVSHAVLTITAQKPNVRVISYGQWSIQSDAYLDYKRVNGGLLVQENDALTLLLNELHVVSERQPSTAELTDLQFAWKVAKFVKSNAIVYAKNQRTLGIGADQTSRIMSAKVAAWKAQEVDLTLQGATMASDAFLPFADSVDAAAAVGITAIIQPGGSIRDEAIIDAANKYHIAMVFTGIRHFRH